MKYVKDNLTKGVAKSLESEIDLSGRIKLLEQELKTYKDALRNIGKYSLGMVEDSNRKVHVPTLGDLSNPAAERDTHKAQTEPSTVQQIPSTGQEQAFAREPSVSITETDHARKPGNEYRPDNSSATVNEYIRTTEDARGRLPQNGVWEEWGAAVQIEQGLIQYKLDGIKFYMTRSLEELEAFDKTNPRILSVMSC